MGKRAATATTQKVQSKVSKLSAETPLDKVSAALGAEGDFSHECRILLTSALPHALSTKGEERHPYQKEILGIVETILSEGEAQRKAAMSVCKTAQRELEAKKTEAATELEQASQIASMAAATKDSKEALCVDAELALEVQKKHLDEKLTAVQALEDDKTQTLQVRDHHQAVMTEVWAPLKEGTLEGRAWRERNKKISQLIALLEKCGLSDSLSAALDSALKTKVDARGVFAVKSLEAAEAISANHLQSLQTKIDSFDGDFAKAMVAIEEARGHVAEAESALASAQEESISAQNRWAEDESKVVELKQKITMLDPQTRLLLENVEAAKAEVESFAEIVSGFGVLRDGDVTTGEAEMLAEAEEERVMTGDAEMVAEAEEEKTQPAAVENMDGLPANEAAP